MDSDHVCMYVSSSREEEQEDLNKSRVEQKSRLKGERELRIILLLVQKQKQLPNASDDDAAK